MSTRELFGDSSSDEEGEKTSLINEEETKKSEPTTEPAAAASEPPKEKRTIEDDDDEDEDDVEFDDKAAVVGLSSTTLAGDKKNVTPREDEDNKESPEEETIKVDKRKLVVQRQEQVPNHVTMHVTKLPNLVGIQPTAFDPDTYNMSLEEDEFGQSVYNLIRWRYQKDNVGHLKRDNAGNLLRESNTRLVEWEDGSYTLHIGKEAFEVDSIDNRTASGFAGLNGYLYLSQKATLEDEDGMKEPAGTVLESMGPIASRMTARPSSLQSEAHKSLTVAVRQKTIKKARIAEFVTQEDPEKLKQERIRVKEDLDKANARKRSSSGYRPSRPRMSRSYLEEEEDLDYDTFHIKDTKRRMRDAEEMDDYGDESDEEEDDQVFHTLRSREKSKEKDSDDDIVMDDDEDEEEEEVVHVHKAKKPTSRAVLDDDDSD